MKFHKVSEGNTQTSLGSDLFANNRPFEAVSTPTKSFSDMRARRSPSLAGSSVSIGSSFRNKGYWWFFTNWSVLINNNSFTTTFFVNVGITARHQNGTQRTSNTVASIAPGQSSSTSFSPPLGGFSTMIMDGDASPELDFVINVSTTAFVSTINFNWTGTGTNFSESTFSSTFSITQLTTTRRDLSTWGFGCLPPGSSTTCGGVNVTVALTD